MTVGSLSEEGVNHMRYKPKPKRNRYIRNILLYGFFALICFTNIKTLLFGLLFIALIVVQVWLAKKHWNENTINPIDVAAGKFGIDLPEKQTRKEMLKSKKEAESQLEQNYNDFLAKIDRDFAFEDEDDFDDYDEEYDEDYEKNSIG